jgi:hypothetical protein
VPRRGSQKDVVWSAHHGADHDTSRDAEILWDFLAMAAYEPHVAAAKAVPMVAAYLDGWQQPEDFGSIAELDAAAIGAAWARQFAPSDHPAAWHADRTPEISVGVKESARGVMGQFECRRPTEAAVARASPEPPRSTQSGLSIASGRRPLRREELVAQLPSARQESNEVEKRK